ncbi:M24 family metallopeptidase [Maribacter sp. HTCC2170]|uniref:M24 family metallopeptidase n=1 Tax=Maribacter sp. (strain HTCC2170 / KCCM 42371) TaxID=313603 RepID=UPI00006B4772|nr:Xaa-Pro peptidase family protein [Maribacter sp. HTCC2170]EAR01886.1 metallopeptidase, M24 family protein [Maribacter sp. HTCC2170]
MKRRNFINKSIIGAGAAITASAISCTSKNEKIGQQEPNQVKSMIKDVSPISLGEIKSRIQKAQNLMVEQGVNALILDAGTSLKYFTGLSWWPSERPLVAIIPASGSLSYICPGFEKDRLEEILKVKGKIYAWQEDESPYEQIAVSLKESNIINGKIGIEERLRFFIYNGIKKEAPHFEYVSADPITIPCRIIKTSAEIALMQRATNITIEAIQMGFQNLKVGSSPSDFSPVVASAHRALGANHAFAMANFAEASAFPHGSTKPQILKKGDVVLVDCGCTVHGYNSDISRTIVFGAEPTERQREIWVLEKKAQSAGYSAAQVGAPLHNVDEAARKVLTDAGFGPDYKLPGLPHRTGHGIGMDGHEWGNAVRGNELLIEPGMCFSIEPNISIVGEFGVRLEDCVYMTENGPKWFSDPSPSIKQPFV